MYYYRRTTTRRVNPTEPTTLNCAVVGTIGIIGILYLMTKKWFWITMAIFMLIGWVCVIAEDIDTSEVRELRQEIESGTPSYCYTTRSVCDANIKGKTVKDLVFVRGDGHRYECISYGAYETETCGKDGFVFVTIKGALYYGKIVELSEGGYGFELYTGVKVHKLKELVYTYDTVTNNW